MSTLNNPNVVSATSDRGRTVRQRVVDALKAKLVAMTDGGEPVWRQVLFGELDDITNERLPVVSIDFGTEQKLNENFPVVDYSLPVFFTFKYRGQRGLDEHDVYQYYLGLLQFALLGDHNLDGLALNVEEDSNSHTIIGINDPSPGGVLSTSVLYRTRLHNPYKLKHET
jgi:hypothetical protein